MRRILLYHIHIVMPYPHFLNFTSTDGGLCLHRLSCLHHVGIQRDKLSHVCGLSMNFPSQGQCRCPAADPDTHSSVRKPARMPVVLVKLPVKNISKLTVSDIVPYCLNSALSALMVLFVMLLKKKEVSLIVLNLHTSNHKRIYII